jgi:hypothetical protein
MPKRDDDSCPGMQTSDKKRKPALEVWDAYLKAKYERL